MGDTPCVVLSKRSRVRNWLRPVLPIATSAPRGNTWHVGPTSASWRRLSNDSLPRGSSDMSESTGSRYEVAEVSANHWCEVAGMQNGWPIRARHVYKMTKKRIIKMRDPRVLEGG
ncbi:hypothetical protein Tco_1034470 [Tanacetum coccineum]